MTAKVPKQLVLIFASAFAASLVPTTSWGQNARLGTETGLDRAMQQNAVKDRGFELKRYEKVDKAEEAAYKAFVTAIKSDPARRIRLGEGFATKFPTSHYLSAIYGVLTISYFATGDTDKMFVAGTKALQLDPRDVDVMAILAAAIPRLVKPGSPDAAERLQTAEVYAQRAIDIIPTLTKPPKVDDASFEKAKNDKLALAYSGLGLIDIDRKKYGDARDELTQAIQLASYPDPVDYFLLGNAEVQGKHFEAAISAYERCATPGPLAAQCKMAEDSAKQEAELENGTSARGARAKADSWYPTDVDENVPEVDSSAACPLDDVVARAGKRVQELASNVDKFTATEIVEHQTVDALGQLRTPEIKKFNYLVSIEQMSDGYMNVEEYRDGGSSPDQFPDHLATTGTPTLVLIFHPSNAKNFKMTCEGLGHWQGRPAWQVRFEERADRHPAISALVMSGRSFALRLRGRAWILADSYQVARLQCDLQNEIPEIRLRLQHEDIEYRPVTFKNGGTEFWLPSSTKFYMDFRGHRFYRLHDFTDFQLFSVDVDQKLSNLKN